MKRYFSSKRIKIFWLRPISITPLAVDRPDRTIYQIAKRHVFLAFVIFLIRISGLPFDSQAAETPALQDILAQSSQVASSIKKTSGVRDNVLRRVMTMQLAIKDIEGALKTISLMDLNKDQALSQVVKTQAEMKDLQGAKRTASAIQSELSKTNAVSQIAIAQAKAADIEGALKTISDLNDGTASFDDALKEIATAQAKTGDIKGALETALKIMDYYPQALWDIVIPMTKAGDIKGAKQIISNITDKYHRGYALWGIVQGQLILGDVDGAI